MLIGWVGGRGPPRSPGEARRRSCGLALDSLASVFGRDVGELRSRLRGFRTRTTGRPIPFAGGAYSYGGVGAIEARAALTQPVEGTLFLAGEAVAEGGGTPPCTGRSPPAGERRRWSWSAS